MAAEATPDEDPAPVDAYVEQLESRVGARDPRRLRGLLRQAISVAWTVSHRETTGLVLAQIIGSLVTVGQVILARSVAEALLAISHGTGTARGAVPALIGLAGVTALGSLIATAASQRQQLLGELITVDSWSRLLNVATSVRLEAFDDPAFYDRMSRVETYALTQPLAVVQGLLGSVGGAVGVIGVLATLLAIAPLLVPVVLLGSVPLLILQRRGSKIEYGFAIEQTPALRARYAISEVLTGRTQAKEIRAFGTGPLFRERYGVLYASYIAALRRKLWRRFVLTLFAALVLLTTTAATVLLLAYLVDSRGLSVGNASAAAAAVALLGGRVQALTAGAGGLFQSAFFLEDLRLFIESADHPYEQLGTPEAARSFDELRCEGVSYTYPGQTEPALSDVSLTLRRGEVIALVGENGSGKTTLSKLLAHLYEPQSGRILWDGVDITDIPLADRRAGTTVLFQDFVHYETSAYDNVALGDPDRIDDAAGVDAALSRAGANGVIAGLPGGLTQFLSQRFPGGRDLSGGQWQRVSLARALFREAPFVLLDEPTAALDPLAEAAFFDTLKETLLQETVLFVSHRFSSVRHADRILVMSNGKIVEEGTHAELMRVDNVYARLYSLQAAGYSQPVRASRPGAWRDVLRSRPGKPR